MTTNNDCQCQICQGACRQKPGWFTPDQIEPLAQSMGLTVQQLFDEHLQIDWWTDSPKNIYILSPRGEHGRGGTMFSTNPRAQCHWFQDGKCAIHTLGKPFECREMTHDSNDRVSVADHESVAMTWNNPDAQKMIADLYGSEPCEPSNDDDGYSIYGILANWDLF